MRVQTTVILTAIGLALLSGAPAHARLGESKAVAEMYMWKFEPVLPTLVLNTKGQVIREHWESPPEMWTMEKADRIRDALVDGDVPTSKKKDGHITRFKYKNGSVVEYGTFQNKVTHITAFTKEYDPNKDYPLIRLQSFNRR